MSEEPDDRLFPAPPKTGWIAKWIWLRGAQENSWRNSYVLFRKQFDAGGQLQIHVAADSRYELYLDGQRIARGTDSSAAGYKSFDTWTTEVSRGKHALAVLVHHVGEVCATSLKSRPGLLVEARDSAGQAIASDDTWQASACAAFRQDLPCMMSHFGFYQMCDYRNFPPDWAQIRPSDPSWPAAEVIADAGSGPWGKLFPRDIPPLQTTPVQATKIIARGTWTQGEFDAMEKPSVGAWMGARRRKSNDGPTIFPLHFEPSIHGQYAAFDFGREVTGHLRLRFEGAKAAQQIDVGYDETLDASGLPNPRRTYVHFADRLVLRENQTVAEIFDARGFRYVMLDLPPDSSGLTITSVELDERTYPMPQTGRFDCSDPSLPPLYDIGVETTRLSMLDVYVDCPSRERVLWMDCYLEALCSSYGAGITRLWRRVLLLYAQDRFKGEALTGAIKAYCPSDNDVAIPNYVMFYACAVSDYVQHSGDLATGGALFDIVMQQFDLLDRFATPQGLFGTGWPSWHFIDWSAMDYGGVPAAVNAIFILMHRKVARLATLLGHHDAAKSLDARRKHLEQAFHHAFWNTDEGLFVDAIYDGKPSAVRSQLSNVLAIVAGIISGEQARSLLRRVCDPSRLLPRTPGDYRLKPGFQPQTGGIVPVGTPALATFLAVALFESGMDEEALDYIRVNWPPLAVNGAFAEHFLFDNNTSFCHGWSAAPTFLFPRYILGARPAAPGWKTVSVRPRACGLQWAKGTILTPLGPLHIHWKATTGAPLELSIDAPPGMKVITTEPTEAE